VKPVVTPRVRKRIDRLDASEREALRNAFRLLIKSPDGTRNYKFWADIHLKSCPHQSALFLPWHRAYLFAFEDALRAIGAATVTLPFWDWTVLREIPPLVKEEPLTSDRDENPDPNGLPFASTIAQILDEQSFERFGGLDCEPLSAGGDLENAHGTVHTWVGPTMGSPHAAEDPLFWFHHAYVDKLWHDWQQRHSGEPPCPTEKLEGVPGPWLVRDVLDIDGPRLRYGYEDVLSVQGELRFEPEKDAQKLRLLTRAIGGRPRIRFDRVEVAGEGEAPTAFEVRLTPDSADPIAVVSLFGLHTHLDYGTERGVVPGPEHGRGNFAASLRLTGEELGQAEDLTLVARWSPAAKQRAAVRVGGVAIGDV
jgi:tyrosinase